MSSLLRRQQRKIARAAAGYETRSRVFEYFPDGSYRVLRPTKGWRYVSAARLRAQFRLGQIAETIQRRMAR